jgi:hypothetical protein
MFPIALHWQKQLCRKYAYVDAIDTLPGRVEKTFIRMHIQTVWIETSTLLHKCMQLVSQNVWSFCDNR